MNLAYTRTLYVALLITVSLGIHQQASAQKKSEKPRYAEKRVTINQTNWNMRASVSIDSNILQIVRSPASNDTLHVTQRTVAELTIRNVSEGAFDFAIEDDGKILWLLLERQRNILPGSGSVYVIYPLAPGAAGKDVGEFQWIHNKNMTLPHQGDATLCLDITQVIRSYLVDMFKRGESISLGRGAGLANVTLTNATESGGVIVSGDIGAKHAFSCHISYFEGERVQYGDVRVYLKE